MVVDFDGSRKSRTGIPEAILAEPKYNHELVEALVAANAVQSSLLITRIRSDQIDEVNNFANENKLKYYWDDPYNRTCILYREALPKLRIHAVGIISAGSSDNYLVEEVKLSLRYMGIQSIVQRDKGVAGYQRHETALKELLSDATIKCLIVIAGQDGALFPTIAAKTKLPVLALPSKIGYGIGGKGEAALQTALQSCAPGVAVLNIDNGFGAAAIACKIILTLENL